MVIAGRSVHLTTLFPGQAMCCTVKILLHKQLETYIPSLSIKHVYVNSTEYVWFSEYCLHRRGNLFGPEVIKLFSYSTTEQDFSNAHKIKLLKDNDHMCQTLALKLSDVVLIMLINIK